MDKINNIYDNVEFFEQYKKMRANELNANELLEIPVIIKMLPSIKDKVILDLGCGFGNMSKFFIDNGARHVTAIDISENMLSEAKKTNSSPKIKYKKLAIENVSELNYKYDLVFSSLAVHYIENFKKLCTDIQNLLNQNGYFLFSQEHPINTAIVNPEGEKLEHKYVDIHGKRYFLLSDYNNESSRQLSKNVYDAIKYHRTFGTVINNLTDEGFTISSVEESAPNDKATKLVPKYSYQKDRPYFLFIRAKKNLLR